MNNTDAFYIAGHWKTYADLPRREVTNPANNKVIATIHMADAAVVDAAVAAAKLAFTSYSRTTKEYRLGLLDKFLDIYNRRYDEMAGCISQEMGAPIDVAHKYQAWAGVKHTKGYIQAYTEQQQRTLLANGDTVVREPIGVCGLITPWNWPINQISLKTIAALATGCTCVLKPSEYTPLSAQLFAAIIDEAGFPAGTFNLIQGDGPNAGSRLSKHPDIRMISFTGSTRAGIAISKDAADTVKRVTLELGGKSPSIVFADADLNTTVRATIGELLLNSGQSCDAPTRLLVERDVYDSVVAIAKDVVDNQTVGDPSSHGDHLGPLVNEIQFDRVQTLIQAGIDEGARVVSGGTGKPENGEDGYYVRPTIFADVRNDMRIAQEEIFGPVVVVIPFDTEDEAIQIANDTPYGLAAYVQTQDRDRAERVAAQLQVGAVHINNAGLQPGSPFGGFKQSGNGREGGIFGIEDYQEVKTLHFGGGI